MNIPSPTHNDNLDLDFSRVDFELNRWRQVIHQKGVEVEITKAYQCPCKTSQANSLSNCLSCGGSGWFFVNKVQTRILMQHMNKTRDFQDWTESNKGNVNFTCYPNEQLNFMDRIVRLNAISIYNEVINFQVVNNITFAFTVYNIQDIESLLLFTSPFTKHKLLVKNVDYIFENNIITLSPQFDIFAYPDQLTATVRYYHHPTFHVIDLDREAVDNFYLTSNSEQVQQLPLKGVARRAHYIENMENLLGNRLLNNDFVLNQSDATTLNQIFTTQFGQQFI